MNPDIIRATYARQRAAMSRHLPFGWFDADQQRVLIKRTAQECGVEVVAVEAALSEAAAFKYRRSA